MSEGIGRRGGRWLYHLVVRQPLPEGRYAPESLAREGFVHCSYADAVAESARLYFAAGADVVAWRIDPARLDVPVEVATTPRGAMPHVRGSVAREAIVAVCERGEWGALADAV